MFERKPYLRSALCVVILSNVILLIVLLTPLTESLHKPLIINHKPALSDVIVILSGDAYASGLPNFETMVRLIKGLELYRQGWAPKIICAGGLRYVKIRKSIAELMKETLILFGVPSEDILTQDETINTYNDIRYVVKKYGGKFDFSKSIFVTSVFHTFRVKKILQKMGINARVISADPYQLTPKWHERLGHFRIIVREYLAICYFKLRGYI